MSSRASSGPALAGVRSSDQVGAGGLLGNALDNIVSTLGLMAAIFYLLTAIGLSLSFVSKRVGKSPYYTDPTTSYGDRVEGELAGPPAE
jgi:hypothetical protein